MLLPLLFGAAAAAILVAAISLFAGRVWAMRELHDRFAVIRQTIRQASFPLTTSVVNSLAELSRTELVVVDNTGNVNSSSLSPQSDLSNLAATTVKLASNPNSSMMVQVADQHYVALAFERIGFDSLANPRRRVLVLFNQDSIDLASRRAALLPLVTGISTIVLLSSLTLISAGRLANRLSKLQRSVERVADGDFESTVADKSLDELGHLGRAIDRMSFQLRRLWREVNRQQGEKLLHQISAGMAHQLRNTLTGARLALELAQQRQSLSTSDELSVALRELETAESYVRRILLVGAGEQSQRDQAAKFVDCWRDVRSSQAVLAKHWQVDLQWHWEQSLESASVRDGPSFCSAIANLVMNSLQVAKSVDVSAILDGQQRCRVEVMDDGPGVDPTIANELFEPFVTSKPEGMGLGLPLVRRAAERLSGKIEWDRHADRTRFTFICQVEFPESTVFSPEHEQSGIEPAQRMHSDVSPKNSDSGHPSSTD